MGERVRVFQVDAFTSQRFCGNPAGVVLDADLLAEEDMRALARELGNRDTAFLLRPDASDHDLRVRFFTPRNEAAFVGHATLAAHAVLAALRLPPRPRQKQKAGLVQVETLAGSPASSATRIAIRQPVPKLLRTVDARELDAVLAALELTRADLDPRCPAMIAGETSTRLLLGVQDSEILGRTRPHNAELIELSQETGAPGYFVFALDPGAAKASAAKAGAGIVRTEARMFCPALGIDEDPVSGNAHGLLGTYLLQHNLFPAHLAAAGAGSGQIEFSGSQGRYIGRPGRVDVVLQLERGALHSVRIAGEAVIVFATTVEFP
jgi:PhzF family phenazine biosynthesis protein